MNNLGGLSLEIVRWMLEKCLSSIAKAYVGGLEFKWSTLSLASNHKTRSLFSFPKLSQFSLLLFRQPKLRSQAKTKIMIAYVCVLQIKSSCKPSKKAQNTKPFNSQVALVAQARLTELLPILNL